eukprot:1159026-Pelagomonas_calceolata.AAC.5
MQAGTCAFAHQPHLCFLHRARKADRQAGDAAPRRTSLRVRGIKAEGNYAGGIEEELRGGQVCAGG